ncbi:MAG: hypothetical protein ACYDCG_18285 [Candidatus Acidiferrales bacterium]
MTTLAKVGVLLPKPVERKIDELLVFDARCLDAATARELLRLVPALAHIRHAWRAHYRQYGCLACPKPDPTIPIAARLRRSGMPWARIYEAVGIDHATTTLEERKSFKAIIRRTIPHLDDAPRYHLNGHNSHSCHSAAGFCDKCYLRLRRRLSKELRKMYAGRDAKKEIAALSQRFDLAQWLLGPGGE